MQLLQNIGQSVKELEMTKLEPCGTLLDENETIIEMSECKKDSW